MLDHLWGWYERTCNPIVADYDRGKRDEALCALSELKSSIEAAGLDEDDCMAMSIMLDYLEYSLYESSGDKEEAQSCADKLIAELAAPLPLTYTEIVRRRCLLCLLLEADATGQRNLPMDAVRDLLSGIPRSDRLGDLYCHLAAWAYKHRDMHHLELAREDILIHGGANQASFYWRRIDLMHALLGGEAQPGQLLDLVKSAPSRHCLESLRACLWDDCSTAGIVTPEVEQAYAAKLAALPQRQYIKEPSQA